MCANGTNTRMRTSGSSIGIGTTTLISTHATFRMTAMNRTRIRTCICRSRTATRIFLTFITGIDN
ncbi:hypothetical protein WS54_30855 [Burkholderia sp. NRF60-BP8]|nr:hypothetical protein WS54_30855 [Burkholderia sp. NRF60-BP8]KVA10595.1 hypothetical protein WS54_18315 [Burkholderia sp. NRF60-BP8]KVL11006.1 hypothetical protein WS95_05060 [Burkholderia sp. MSMB1826]